MHSPSEHLKHTQTANISHSFNWNWTTKTCYAMLHQ